MLALLICVCLSATAGAVAVMHAWRATRPGGRGVSVRRTVAISFLVQIALIPVSAVAGRFLAQWRNPNDDWFDIVGFAAGSMQVAMLIPTTLLIWLLARTFELSRQRARADCCRACGYECGPSASDICPECGEHA